MNKKIDVIYETDGDLSFDEKTKETGVSTILNGMSLNGSRFYRTIPFRDFMIYFLGYAFITGIQFTYAEALFELNGAIIPLA